MKNLDWLVYKEPQIILFRNRKHYIKKGVFHNIDGPAVESLDSNTPNEYYIKGERYEYDKWAQKSKVLKRKRLLNKL